MYDVDFMPDADVYYYGCAICKKDVRTRTIKTCLHCESKVCEDHYIEGFCSRHYLQMSKDGMDELYETFEYTKNQKKSLTYWQVALGSISSIITLIVGIIVALTFYPALIAVLLIGSFVICASIAPIESEKEKWDQKLTSKRRGIFYKYRKVDDEIENRDKNLSKPPLIENICKNCGRNLRLDAKFCDNCGQKIIS